MCVWVFTCVLSTTKSLTCTSAQWEIQERTSQTALCSRCVCVCMCACVWREQISLMTVVSYLKHIALPSPGRLGTTSLNWPHP